MQKPTLRSYFTTKKGNFHTRIWRHCNKRQIGTNLYIFAFFQQWNHQQFSRIKETSQIFPCNFTCKYQILELYLPNQDISTDQSLTLWIGCLSFKQYFTLRASKFGISTSSTVTLSLGTSGLFLHMQAQTTQRTQNSTPPWSQLTLIKQLLF
jgi:hypothetical protein